MQRSPLALTCRLPTHEEQKLSMEQVRQFSILQSMQISLARVYGEAQEEQVKAVLQAKQFCTLHRMQASAILMWTPDMASLLEGGTQMHSVVGSLSTSGVKPVWQMQVLLVRINLSLHWRHCPKPLHLLQYMTVQLLLRQAPFYKEKPDLQLVQMPKLQTRQEDEQLVVLVVLVELVLVETLKVTTPIPRMELWLR